MRLVNKFITLKVSEFEAIKDRLLGAVGGVTVHWATKKRVTLYVSPEGLLALAECVEGGTAKACRSAAQKIRDA